MFLLGKNVKINTFDDSNKKYKYLKNNWRVQASLFNGDKIIVRNNEDVSVTLRSISTWKVSSIESYEENNEKNNKFLD